MIWDESEDEKIYLCKSTQNYQNQADYEALQKTCRILSK